MSPFVTETIRQHFDQMLTAAELTLEKGSRDRDPPILSATPAIVVGHGQSRALFLAEEPARRNHSQVRVGGDFGCTGSGPLREATLIERLQPPRDFAEQVLAVARVRILSEQFAVALSQLRQRGPPQRFNLHQNFRSQACSPFLRPFGRSYMYALQAPTSQAGKRPECGSLRELSIELLKPKGGLTSMVLSTKIEHWPIDRLVPYARNARTHSEQQVAQVAASIREFGFTNPILVDTESGVLAGHARLAAARKLGLPEVPVIVLDHLTEVQKRAYVLVDNKLALNAGWDDAMLAVELEALKEEEFNLDLLGFDEDELDRLCQELDGACKDANEAPAVEEAVVSKLGDLWLLGEHRVLCGDSLADDSFQRLLDGEPAGMVFTDPPYNVDYAPEDAAGRSRRIANDNLGQGFGIFLGQVCSNLISYTDGAIYICMSSSELHTLAAAFREAGGHWSTFIIWAKDRFSLGRSDYQRQYEPILYGWPVGKQHHWCGDRTQSDLWEVDRPTVNDLHPTMKPVDLVERAINNSSQRGAIVLDAFGGSGSTLIACQKTGRKGRLIEVEPKYVDVIVRRWQEFTGLRAQLLGDGRDFDAVAEERLQVAETVLSRDNTEGCTEQPSC